MVIAPTNGYVTCAFNSSAVTSVSVFTRLTAETVALEYKPERVYSIFSASIFGRFKFAHELDNTAAKINASKHTNREANDFVCMRKRKPS